MDGAPPAAASASPFAAASPFGVGDRVRLRGLNSKPELNGQLGRVVGFQQAKGRVNISLEGGRTLQVKPANLCATTATAGELSAEELSTLTLGDHAALTPAHAERVIKLLASPSSAIEVGRLLRCCCCIGWHMPATRNVRNGAEKDFVFPNSQPDATQAGTTIVLASDPDKLTQLLALNTPPAGSEKLLRRVRGKQLFNASRLHGVGMISLDPYLGASAKASSFTALPAAYFPPLCHMSEAIHVEALLATVAATCEATMADKTDPPTQEMRDAAKAFCSHTFFCFNASPDASSGSIIPVTAMSPHGSGGATVSWMLVYTCEMVLEHARPHMEALGAFRGHSQPMAASAVPGKAILESLHASGSANAGVHVNEFVPGLDAGHKFLGLTTSALERLFGAAEGFGLVV